jgi:hypothetical protein
MRHETAEGTKMRDAPPRPKWPALTLLLAGALLFCGRPVLWCGKPETEPEPDLLRFRFESPPTFRASEILPPDLLAGPDHRIEEEVVNDGFMNIYTINSRFGVFTAKSNAELRIRVGEVNSIAKMEDWSETEQFAMGVGRAGLDSLDTAAQLLADPVGTTKQTASGIKEMFDSVSTTVESLGHTLADEKGNGVKNIHDIQDIVDLEDIGDLVGFSRAKRQYAVTFGVDPYSTNPVLQQQLTRVALAGFLGHFSARAALGLVSGAVGTAISITNDVDSLRRTVEDRAPEEISAMNERKLLAMKVPQTVVDLFLANTVFSPSYQTAFVANLEEIDGAADRAAFVKMAVLARNEDQVLFRVQQARMYANYHRSVTPIRSFAQLSKMAVVTARTADGTVVVCGPVDYLSLTLHLAGYFQAARSGLENVPDVTGKELWIAGGISPMAREWVEENGWEVHANAEEQLLPEPVTSRPTSGQSDGGFSGLSRRVGDFLRGKTSK